MVGEGTGIQSMRWPFSKDDKELGKTGTIRAGTVCELRPTKVHRKGTHHDHCRATGAERRDREVSSIQAAADSTEY
ncbi:MAG: hypothetical protein EZS28_008248 [Streblomastix strix]|uniref:Uncharacterized protein n=1 Tax=Streblomastix strix TaxID=222440 RepID=A0A5J4WP74_9EUKA|nr:MAG: hypothetical protein EZS28_008248 [Streblomastix strix]